ncbi:PepSY domain-containing protein [Bacillus testis]|uniref:PepSY domain-containing protein n=1 Tax=Bacillus testis TaxID=1622072 RepID=UPI00067E8372|nr:PepSY domain-containing protein [Bacillus testis]
MLVGKMKDPIRLTNNPGNPNMKVPFRNQLLNAEPEAFLTYAQLFTLFLFNGGRPVVFDYYEVIKMRGLEYTVTSLALVFLMAGCSTDDSGDHHKENGHHSERTVETAKSNVHTVDLKSAQEDMSVEDAITLAKMKSEGDLTKIQLEKDRNRYVYEIEMMTNTNKKDLKIDTNTKQVLKQDSENLDADEIGTERQNKKLSLDRLIDSSEAVSQAEKKGNGKATSWELQREGDMTYYEIDVVDKSGAKQQIKVDANNKGILEVEND